MNIEIDKRYIIRLVTILLVIIMIKQIKYYVDEYDFSIINEPQATVYYTVTTDDLDKNKTYLSDIKNIEKQFEDDHERSGIYLNETKRTGHLVEYEIDSSIENNKKFHEYISKNFNEFFKKTPIKSNPVAEQKDINSNPNQVFEYSEKVGFRVVPSIHIPVIGALLSTVLNSRLGCYFSITALVLFIIMVGFTYIPSKNKE